MAVIHECLLSDSSNTVEFSIKERITIRLSREVVDAFRAIGSDRKMNEKHFRESKKTQFIGNKHFGLFSTPQV